MKSERAFTLIELLIYIAIFAVVAGFFTSILLITLRVQGTQSGVVNVSTELNFALQTIQRNIRESTIISGPISGGTANSLSLSGGPLGPVVISIGSNNCGLAAPNNSSICITVNGGTPTPLTTSKSVIDSLSFTHYATPSSQPCPGTPCVPDTHTVQINVSASNNTSNPAEKISRTLSAAASPLNQ